MQARVVCISGADGAGAGEAAALVAEQLGYRLIDEEILVRAAAHAGVEPHVLADVEHRKSLLKRLLDGLGGADMGAYGMGEIMPVGESQVASDELRGLIRSAIEEAALEGNAVIVAHAASIALAGRDDVLRVLITASPGIRASRFAEERSLDENEATRAIATSDAGRVDYLKRFYGISTELPTHYDVVVNTDRITPHQAAAVIVCGAADLGSVEPS